MNAIAEALPKTEGIDPTAPPAPGELWPEQGGRYVGSYIKDGQLRHGISAAGVENDILCSYNTQGEKTAGITHNGFSDWGAPDQVEAMLTYINTKHLPDEFVRKGVNSIYLTSSPYGSNNAWVVGFEDGSVSTFYRSDSFRVRLFRSISA